MSASTIKAVNPVKTGSLDLNTGITASELRIKQTGKVVEFNCYLTLSNASSNPYSLGYIRGVDLPPTNIRTIVGTGTAAYQATNPAYFIISAGGGMELYRSKVTDTIVNIDVVYTVD